MGQNIKKDFRSTGLKQLFEDIARVYRVSEFRTLFAELSYKHPAVARYLEVENCERWSRAHFPGDRYNIMTSNNSESLNSAFNEARVWPIVALLEHIRSTLGNWFYERRVEAEKCKSPVTVEVEIIMKRKFVQSCNMKVIPINQFEFNVKDEVLDGLVNIEELSCSCREFDIDKIPCAHAIAAAQHRSIDMYSLCSDFYKTDYWRMAYAESIYPVPGEKDWDVPEATRAIIVNAPDKKTRSGRPKTKRKRSIGEFSKKKRKCLTEESGKENRKKQDGAPPKKKRKCSNCGIYGHNKTSCKNSMMSTTNSPSVS
ncbi:Zinc finger, PMZ-type [Trema orientale]|uniref:Zinc finger, PMZ-type n=1 Tax=Trema orientale TaxID=63057 RepID=A0A2P5F4B6_TREOI|nr:Zinc finger, PMZ-type [Trema orientale]